MGNQPSEKCCSRCGQPGHNATRCELPAPSLEGSGPTRRCSRCRRSKPLTAFSRDNYKCYPCTTAYKRELDSLVESDTTPKDCMRCGTVKPANEMSRGHRGLCRDCWNTWQREYRAKRKAEGHDVNRATELRARYGMTLTQYAELLASQNGCCAICASTEAMVNPTKRKYSLAVDHDESTGRVRGILCTNCNQGLGKFKHDVKLFAAAIEYLQKAIGRRG